MSVKIYISILLLFASAVAFGQGKRALIVAISDYPKSSGFAKISGTNDYEIVSKTLEKQGFTINALLNSDATAANIRQELGILANATKSGDYVYIHFSTHGQPFEDRPPFDEEDSWDESVVAYDASKYYKQGVYEGENHILDDELSAFFERIRTAIGKGGFLCVAIDACHSGSSSRDEDDDEIILRGTNLGFSLSGKIYAPKIEKSYFGNVVALQHSDNQSDILILESCKSHQFNREITENGTNYGPLSYYIAQTLQNQRLDKSMDWALEVRKKMQNDIRLSNQNMVIETSLK